MDHLLNLSTAAKLVGVSRGTIQSKIRSGELETFEGHVRMSALRKVYPEVGNITDTVLERVNRIRDSVMRKVNVNSPLDERLLAKQVNQLQFELREVNGKLDSYKTLIIEIHERLSDLKDGCERKEKQQLQALLNWMSAQL